MSDENNEGGSPGEIIAAKMVENLVIANENLVASQATMHRLIGSIDELAGYFECFGNAMNILSDMMDGSKTKKLTSGDFVHAWVTAEEETFGGDDSGGSKDDDPDDDDDDDPRVPGPEPVEAGDRRV